MRDTKNQEKCSGTRWKRNGCAEPEEEHSRGKPRGGNCQKRSERVPTVWLAETLQNNGRFLLVTREKVTWAEQQTAGDRSPLTPLPAAIAFLPHELTRYLLIEFRYTTYEHSRRTNGSMREKGGRGGRRGESGGNLCAMRWPVWL